MGKLNYLLIKKKLYNKEKAISEFNTYVHEYHAEISEDDEWVAFCNEGHFYLEEREV